MKKNMIALAVAAAMIPGFAAAEGATVSGYADITFKSTNDTSYGNSGVKNIFGAAAEINVRNTVGDVTVGADADIGVATNNTNSSAQLEQAFFAWNAGPATIIGGVFNNPIGLDAEDSTDMVMVSHSAVYDALNSQTVLHGNNIAGVAAAFAAGPATITAALLNDLQHARDDSNNDTLSVALVANMSPMEGLDLELSHVTQESDGVTTGATGDAHNYTTNKTGLDVNAGVGNVTNFNAAFTMGQVSASLDYLMPSEVVDSVYDLTLGFQANDALGVAVRFSETAYADKATINGAANQDLSAHLADTSSITLQASYKIADNLKLKLEHKADETDVAGSEDTSMTTAKFIATF